LTTRQGFTALAHFDRAPIRAGENPIRATFWYNIWYHTVGIVRPCDRYALQPSQSTIPHRLIVDGRHGCQHDDIQPRRTSAPGGRRG
jgi:hypothetical protein